MVKLRISGHPINRISELMPWVYHSQNHETAPLITANTGRLPIRRSIRPNAVKFASNGEVVGARQVLAIVSSEQRDRMGDVILQDGIDYSDFHARRRHCAMAT
jgi:hypothetical protein